MTDEVKPLFQYSIPPYSPRRRNSIPHRTGSFSQSQKPLSTFHDQGSRTSFALEEEPVTPPAPFSNNQTPFFQIVPIYNEDLESGSALALVPVTKETIRRSLDGVRPPSWVLQNTAATSGSQYRLSSHSQKLHSDRKRQASLQINPQPDDTYSRRCNYSLEQPLLHQPVPQPTPSQQLLPLQQPLAGQYSQPNALQTQYCSSNREIGTKNLAAPQWELPQRKSRDSFFKRITRKLRNLFRPKYSHPVVYNGETTSRSNLNSSPAHDYEEKIGMDYAQRAGQAAGTYKMHRVPSHYRNQVYESFLEE